MPFFSLVSSFPRPGIQRINNKNHTTISSSSRNKQPSTSLFLRRAGIVSVALASYGAIVYFTYEFVSATVEKTNHGAGCCAASHVTGDRGKQDHNLQQRTTDRHKTSYVTDPDRHVTFHKIASVYDSQISKEENVMLLPLLRRWLIYFHARGKVLEVGAGTGRNLDYYSFTTRSSSSTQKKDNVLSSQVGVEDVILTDISEEMLLRAREKVKQHKHRDRFKLFVADAKEMTKYYPNGTFDTIVDTFGLCSFDDPVAVLKELQRICKPNGKILLLEHGRSKSCGPLTNYLDKTAERHAKNWGCVYNRDLDAILKESGLQIETLWTWHFGTTYYVVCRPGST